AIRRALGAGRARLVRQLLTEGLVLSVAGTVMGGLLAAAAPALLAHAAPGVVPVFATPRIDGTRLLFAAILGLAVPGPVGLVPASTWSRADRLSMRTTTASRQATRARELLVACEAALAIVLLVGAVLLSRTLFRLHQVDPGFQPRHAISFIVSLPKAR